MLWKNYVQKKRMKGMMIWELLIPILFVVYIQLVFTKNPCLDPDYNCSRSEEEYQA